MQKEAKSIFISLFLLIAILSILLPSISFGAIQTIQVGKHPKAVAVNTATSRAVAANEKDGTVSIIDLTAPSVIATVTVGKRPTGVDINEQTNQAVVANKKDNTVSIINLADFTVIATINVGKDPVSVVINELTNKAYVTNRKDDTMSVIDLNTNTVIASVTTGRDPSGIAVYQTGNKGIVAAEKDGTVQIFDLDTNALVSSVPVGKNPSALVVNETTGRALVANEKDNTVSVVDIAASSVIATISVSRDPKGIAINPDTDKALVTSSKEDRVSIIDLSTNTVLGEIGNGEEPYGAAINRTSNVAVVSNPDENSISIIDLNSTPYATTAPTGKKPYGLDINPETNTAVIANEKSDSVSIIDIGSNTLLTTVDVDKNPVAVAINSATNHAFVANRKSNTLTVIDIPTGTVLATIQTGKDPVAVAVNPVTNRALVANRKDNNMSVIDLTTNTAISSISVGKSPYGMDIDSGLNRAVVANKKDDTVSIIDLASENTLFTVTVGKNPVDVKVNSNTHVAAVTNKKDDTVTILNVSTGTVLSSVPVGRDPNGISINTRTNQALVANEHDKSMSILDLASYTVVDTVSIGTEVRKVAVNRTNNTAVLTGEDSSGATIIHLSGQDVTPPQVTVTSHQDGQTVPSSPITISGTVDDPQAEIHAGTLQAVIINNTFTIEGIELAPGANQIIIKADDIAGNISTINITIFLGATPPVPDVDPLPIIAGECSATISGAPTATDALGNQVTGTTTDPLTFTSEGTHVVTWTYDDGNGNMSTQTQTVIVDDITAPVASVNPLPIIEGEGSVTVSTTPTAMDNCVGLVTGTTTDSLTYATVGDHIINWSYDDGNGNESTQQQTARVLNSPPVASDDSFSMDEDGILITATSVLANDTDADGDALTAVLVSNVSSGALTLNPDGTFTYTPTADFNGTDSFTYTANDGTADSNTATVTITVNAVNDAPVAADDAYTVDEDGVLNALTSVLANDSDIDGDALTAVLVTSTSNGTLALNADGTFIYTPNADFNGTDAFSYTANDGLLDSIAATVQITVNAINDAPVASDDAYTVDEDGTLSIPASGVLSNDTDADGDSLTAALVTGVSNGTLSLSADGSLTYTPNSNYNGTDSFTYAASDGLLQSSAATVTVTVTPVNDLPTASAGQDQTAFTGDTVQLDGSGSSDIDGDALTYAWSIASAPTGSASALSNPTAVNPTIVPDIAGSYIIELVVNDGQSDSLPDSMTIVAEASGPQLPPDPASVAPPVDETVATTVYDSTAFLYTGGNPIQTGVDPLDIVPQRTAVLRGKVLDRNNAPLDGVTLTILDHPEFGQTLSRSDGMFDMVVNGGGELTVVYEKESYLPVQRQISVPWQDYTLLPDVVMIQLDNQVTPINLALGVMLAAQGSIQTDLDGTRQETILFPPGISAEMVMPDGSTQPITNINVRATEYTVGDNGPNAMPAELPPTTAYTYAVALTIDEAMAAGAESVTFSQPVYSYVENFLGFPTGIQVPVGYYDPKRAAWIPSDDGLVIEILSITGGMADLDVDGTGLPADSLTLSNMGFTDEERTQLANLYGIGQSLWRVPVKHFTNYDKNFGSSAKTGAEDPQCRESQHDKEVTDPCMSYGSIIECENQVLGEVIDIAGTPFTLNYRSDRVPGRTAANQLNVTLSNDSVPSVLKRIDLEIHVAGEVFKQSFPALPNQSYVYTHDGKDVYGRALQGGQRAIVRIGYVYDGYYNLPPYVVQSFGLPSGTKVPGDVPTRKEIILWQIQDTYVGKWDARSAGIGGWTLSEHHTYDPLQKAIFFGTGGRRSAEENNLIINTAAGNGVYWFNGDGLPANQVHIGSPHHMNVGPDGSLYFADSDNNRIRKIDPDGIITTVAGTGAIGYTGDGGPATQAKIYHPFGVDIGPDGSLYFTDWGNKVIRKVDPDGIITTVAGSGAYGDSGDNGPATQATFRYPNDVAVASDGSFYITDMDSYRIRRVDPNGIISTVAGTGVHGYTGDGGPATSARLSYPRGVDIGPDGSLYIAQSGYGVVRKVNPSGIITTIAGNGTIGYSGDGLPATNAALNEPRDIAVDEDGSLYIADCGNARVRKVNAEGIISTVAGSGLAGFIGNNGPSTKAWIQCPSGVAVSPGGTVYVSDYGQYRIRDVKSQFPAFDDSDIVISSEDGSKLYQFNSRGKHLSTVDTLTGAVLYQFNYDGNGYLSSIVDVDGDITTIQRDVNGDPTAVISHDGQQTNLTLDANGFISNITNPANESTDFVYTIDGLLTSLTDPRQNTSIFTYDAEGRLTKDTNAAGGFWQLDRTDYTDGYTVDKTSALGRLTTFDLTYLSNGNRQRLVTDSAGLTTERLIQTNGKTTVTSPDGTVTVIEEGPDPRFGMQSPISKSISVTSPGGLSYIQTANRSVTLEFNEEPLSLLTRTDTVNVNGRTSTGVYNATSRTYTMTTPEGRQRSTTLDALGRVIQYQTAGLEPINYSYDTRGRLDGISTGAVPDDRIYTFTYDANGFLDSFTDPMSRTTSYLNDLVGRTTRLTLPDLREINYTYDANGNVTSITPPGRPAHAFDYNAVNLTSSYNPPDIEITPDTTSYSYSLDKEMIQILRPDASTIGFTYNTAGQLTAMTILGGAYSYTYDPVSGNLSTITDPDSGTLSYTYDGSFLIDEIWSGNVTGTVTRAYNNNFWVTSLAVNGNAIAYSYDNDGLLIGAGSLTLSRNAQNGLLTGTTLGNVTTSLSYNGFAEVTGESASYSSTPLYDSSFVYDKLGRIIEKTETVDSITNTYVYGYDLDGRLDTVSKNSVLVSTYVYDDNGNRLSLITSGGTVSGIYDDQDRLTGYAGATYTYTANGELETKTVGADTTVYDYDELGNLISVTLPDGTFIEYIIDGRNRRVAKLIDGIFVEGFLYQGQLNPVAKIDDIGNIIERYVYADKWNVPAHIIKGGSTYRIISDHLGSLRIVVDINTGSIAQRMDYDEFGNVILDTNPGFQPFGFAGGLYDSQTDLVRFGVRDYDPKTGRWTTKDPIGFIGGDTNLYGYVLNDPINYIDQWGLQAALLRPWLPPATTANKNNPYAPRVPNAIETEEMIQDLSLFNPLKLIPPLYIAERISDWFANESKKPKEGSKPKGCPRGTKPIDKYPGLDRQDIHDIKEGVGAQPKDWTGIAPDGSVITGDSKGNAVVNNPYTDYLPKSKK